jgi:hypothetical protein
MVDEKLKSWIRRKGVKDAWKNELKGEWVGVTAKENKFYRLKQGMVSHFTFNKRVNAIKFAKKYMKGEIDLDKYR